LNFFSNRIHSIFSLSKDRNFAPAILLGGKAIITLSFFLAMQTVSFVRPLETGLDEILASNGFILFSTYVALFVILLGKEIIQIHMIAFSRLDSILRKSLDSYSMKYWKKNKKDSEFLSKFASIQGKLLRPFAKMNPRKRNGLILSLIMTYLFIDYMRFGLLQILALNFSNLLEESVGFRIAS